MTQLSDDRALAIVTLMPRNAGARYDELTKSGRAEVDRLVEAFRTVRQRTMADLTSAIESSCGTPWPPSLQNVTPVRCRLPHGHRSPEHWHPPLWVGTPDLLWWDDGEDGPTLAPTFSAQHSHG